MASLSDLFLDEPEQWGLRGDPHLWREMADSFNKISLPSSSAELECIVRGAFEKLTGCSIDSTELINLDKYDHGGMSSGGISTNFWRESAIPLLVSRLEGLPNNSVKRRR